MQIDSKGYVHVVFVNGRGELIYVKSTNTSPDGKTAYTFGPSVVIAENSPMNVDLTVKGTTPYIGYLTSLGSFDGLNTAFYDKSLDLNNDGLKTRETVVSYDIDGDGKVDKINDSADAVLCFDKDGNGISGKDGSECFGNNTDLDGDGKIGVNDVNNYVTKLKTQGMTYNELTQLCGNSASGMSSLLDTVLSNFTKIDTNHDGRITQSEINAYRINEQIKDVKDKYPKINPTQMSMFYESKVADDTKTTDKNDKVFG